MQIKGRFSLLLYMARGRRLRYLGLFLCVLISAAADLVSPQIIRITVDSVLDNKPFPAYASELAAALGGRDVLRGSLWLIALVLVALGLVQSGNAHFRRYFALENAEQLARRFRDTLYSHIQRLPFKWHVKIQTGDIIQRCTSDVETIKNFLSNDFPEALRTLCQLTLTVCIMALMDLRMTLISIVLVPPILIYSALYHKKVSKGFKFSEEAEGALQAAVQENLTGVRVVRAFGRERYEMERFTAKNDEYLKRSMKVGVHIASFWSFGDMLTGIQMGLILGIGLSRCVNDTLSVGTFISFMTYAGMFIWPVRQLGRMISNLSKVTVSLARIREIMVEQPEPDDCDGRRLRGSIEFQNVSFSYNDGTPVLDKVSFKLEPGETLGILGPTGSGKSTISYLLTRLYDTDEGKILLDGEDIRSIPRADVRANIALVLQEPFLFSRTIKQNISAPRPGASEDEMHSAARAADIHESILGFSDGYDTIVGERGVTLSGGQRQRVAIARMLMQEAPVMIFDDSLSAVDTETDARIRKALREHTSDSAVILISHRISTLMYSDRILVLRDGAVEDYGSHNELISRENAYKRIYEMQSAFQDESGSSERL